MQIHEFEERNELENQELPQESITLNGLEYSSSSSKSNTSPWTSTLRSSLNAHESTNKVGGKEKIVDNDQLSIEKPSTKERGDTTTQPRRSTRLRHLVLRLTYDSFMMNHFSYMSQLASDENKKTI